jgi:hypothetical protein
MYRSIFEWEGLNTDARLVASLVDQAIEKSGVDMTVQFMRSGFYIFLYMRGHTGTWNFEWNTKEPGYIDTGISHIPIADPDCIQALTIEVYKAKILMLQFCGCNNCSDQDKPR